MEAGFTGQEKLMKFHELRWNAGPQPYSMACVIHRATAAQLIIYVTEDGGYDLLGKSSNAQDRRELSELELAAVLAECDPDPTYDPADYRVEIDDGPRSTAGWSNGALGSERTSTKRTSLPRLPNGDLAPLVSLPLEPDELI